MSSSKAEALAAEFKALNDGIIEFATNCSEEDWAKTTEEEGWPIGAVLHHLAMGHYAVIGMIKRVTRGQELPDASSVDIDKMNAKQLEDGVNFTREMAVEAFGKNGGKVHEYMLGLSDEQIDTVHHFSLWGIDVSVGKLFTNVYLKSGGAHYESVKATLAN